MDLKEIQQRNYDATVKRGLINDLTKVTDFYNKIEDEFDEFKIEYKLKYKVDVIEMADIIISCLCMAKHYNIDIQKALEQKTLINENRKD